MCNELLKKNKCNENQLQKPSFEFVHELVVDIVNKTGYLQTLLTDDDFDPDFHKNKNDKILFFKKLIDVS